MSPVSFPLVNVPATLNIGCFQTTSTERFVPFVNSLTRVILLPRQSLYRISLDNHFQSFSQYESKLSKKIIVKSARKPVNSTLCQSPFCTIVLMLSQSRDHSCHKWLSCFGGLSRWFLKEPSSATSSTSHSLVIFVWKITDLSQIFFPCQKSLKRLFSHSCLTTSTWTACWIHISQRTETDYSAETVYWKLPVTFSLLLTMERFLLCLSLICLPHMIP